MLGRSFVLLLLALLSLTHESAAHSINEHDHDDYQLAYGQVVPTELGMHLAVSNITRRGQQSGPSSGYWSHVSAVRQRRFLRIPPSPPNEPVRLVYALCPHEHEQRLLQGAPFNEDQSQITVFLHRSRRDESLEALQKRVEDDERIYDDNWMPIYPEQLTDWEEEGSGAWEGELPHGGMLEIKVSDSWVEDENDEDLPIHQHWADYPVDSHVRFEVERLYPRGMKPHMYMRQIADRQRSTTPFQRNRPTWITSTGRYHRHPGYHLLPGICQGCDARRTGSVALPQLFFAAG